MAVYHVNGRYEDFSLNDLLNSSFANITAIDVCGLVEDRFWQFWASVHKPMIHPWGNLEFGEIPDGVVLCFNANYSQSLNWDDVIKVLPKIAKLFISEMVLSGIPASIIGVWDHKIEIEYLTVDVFIPHDMTVKIYSFGDYPPIGEPIVIDCIGTAGIDAIFESFQLEYRGAWDHKPDIRELLSMFRNVGTLNVWYGDLEWLWELIPDHLFDAECVKINAINNNIRMSMFRNLPIKKLCLSCNKAYELVFDCPDEEILILALGKFNGCKNRERLQQIVDQNANNMRFRRMKIGPS